MARAHLVRCSFALLVVAAASGHAVSHPQLRRLVSCPEGDEDCEDKEAPVTVKSKADSVRLCTKLHGDNSLCKDPMAGPMPQLGAYFPVLTDTVPEDLGKLVAREFLKANSVDDKKKQRTWVGCPEFEATVSEACCQVVQGINYHVTVKAKYCRSGKVTNNKSQVWLDAVVQWMPYTESEEDSLVVTEVGCTDCSDRHAQPPEPEPTSPDLTDSGGAPGEALKNNSLCGKQESDDGSPIAGGYSPVPPSSVPEDFGHLVAKEYLKSQGLEDKKKQRVYLAGCPDFKAEVLEACSQVVAGTNYHVLLEVNFCRSGAATSGKMLLTLEAVVYKPLPFLDEEPTVIGVNCTSCKGDW